MPLACQIVVPGFSMEFLVHKLIKEFIHEILVHNCLDPLKQFLLRLQHYNL